jgi:tRNA pseudouridine55 synthase
VKRKGDPLDGVLLLDKPAGITSNAALQQAKRLFGAAKAGHTGTLDPLATGLLPVCFGEATKFAGLLLEADKTYLATIQLGASTSTGDAEGEVIFRGDVTGLDPARIAAVLEQLTGVQEQVPPMYSALKREGRPLYAYARAGETVERSSRSVTIHELAAVSIEPEVLQLRLRVSKGTYVRSIAEQIGERLGCGAHLKALRREATGGLSLNDSIPLERLSALSPAQRVAVLRPVDILVAPLPRGELDALSAAALQQGQTVGTALMLASGLVRLYDAAGAFLRVGEMQSPGRVAPRRLIASRQRAETPCAPGPPCEPPGVAS